MALWVLAACLWFLKLIEQCHPRDMELGMKAMVWQEIEMLLTDRERFVTYLTLIAEKG